jgi:hypothetical protein
MCRLILSALLAVTLTLPCRLVWTDEGVVIKADSTATGVTYTGRNAYESEEWADCQAVIDSLGLEMPEEMEI